MAVKAPLSLRAYAAHRKRRRLHGGSLQAVQRAIDAGRLRASIVKVGGKAQIKSAAAADREWADNTDPSRRARPASAAPLEESPSEPSDDSFAFWKTKKMRLDYEKAAGEVVNAAEMKAGIADACSIARTLFMGVPTKVKQKHPDVALDVLATMDEGVRDAIEELLAALEKLAAGAGAEPNEAA